MVEVTLLLDSDQHIGQEKFLNYSHKQEKQLISYYPTYHVPSLYLLN